MSEALSPEAEFQAEFRRRAPGCDARPATADDEGFLRSLFVTVQTQILPLPEPLLHMQYDSQRRAYTAAFPQASHLVVERAGRPIGQIWIDWSAPGHTQGLDVSVAASERRGAAGLRLLQAWTATADRRGLGASLSVRPNEALIRLCRRLGFRPTDNGSAPVPMEQAPRRGSERALRRGSV